jgi:hypothetical protein
MFHLACIALRRFWLALQSVAGWPRRSTVETATRPKTSRPPVSNILYLPRIRATAGDKIYTYQDGTTTPQATYQDVSLTTPHANPIVADSAGVFAPIYLDPSLPNYRILHTDTNDVQISQDDGVPASQTNSQRYRLRSSAPELILEETGASTNNGVWRIRASAEQLTVSLGNDAESSFVDAITIDRTGTTVDSIALQATAITLNGSPTQASGSFTGTLTGCVTSPTATVQWRRSGSLVTLTVNAGLTATSNANGMTITGMPVEIRPTQTVTYLTRVTDNGNIGHGVVIVGTGGTLTFGNGITGATFTTSGTKGLPGGWGLIYEVA